MPSGLLFSFEVHLVFCRGGDLLQLAPQTYATKDEKPRLQLDGDVVEVLVRMQIPLALVPDISSDQAVETALEGRHQRRTLEASRSLRLEAFLDHLRTLWYVLQLIDCQ